VIASAFIIDTNLVELGLALLAAAVWAWSIRKRGVYDAQKELAATETQRAEAHKVEAAERQQRIDLLSGELAEQRTLFRELRQSHFEANLRPMLEQMSADRDRALALVDSALGVLARHEQHAAERHAELVRAIDKLAAFLAVDVEGGPE
jgi:hypothetical protein